MEKKFVLGDIVLVIADGPRMVVEGYVVEEDPPVSSTKAMNMLTWFTLPATASNGILFTRTC